MRAPVVLLLAAAAVSLPARWQHNPRERTAAAIEDWKRRDYAAADRELDQALELAGENPRSLFNAGTGRLGAGTPGAALPLLTRAAAASASDASAQALRPESLYNLGNAYLAAGDTAAAAESYRSALRLHPDHSAAKHNLELALRQQEKQQEQQQPQQGGGAGEGRAGDSGGEPQDQEGGGGGGGQDEQPPQPQQSPPPQDGQPRQGNKGRSPRLPGFNPQQDMSAEQAASLLEAVENLEREQRRTQAEQQRAARARDAADKDW